MEAQGGKDVTNTKAWSTEAEWCKWTLATDEKYNDGYSTGHMLVVKTPMCVCVCVL